MKKEYVEYVVIQQIAVTYTDEDVRLFPDLFDLALDKNDSANYNRENSEIETPLDNSKFTAIVKQTERVT